MEGQYLGLLRHGWPCEDCVHSHYDLSGHKQMLELAKRLSTHPKVAKVHYPGLATDTHHGRAKSFMKGFGAVLSLLCIVVSRRPIKFAVLHANHLRD